MKALNSIGFKVYTVSTLISKINHTQVSIPFPLWILEVVVVRNVVFNIWLTLSKLLDLFYFKFFRFGTLTTRTSFHFTNNEIQNRGEANLLLSNKHSWQTNLWWQSARGNVNPCSKRRSYISFCRVHDSFYSRFEILELFRL